MPAFPTFTSPINQASNTTLGWNSKALYVYQNSDVSVTVFNGDDVFSTLQSDGTGQKGSFVFKPPYFDKPNINQGRLIKVTMYFWAEFAGQTISMDTGLRDLNSGDTFYISPRNTVIIDNVGGGTSYCKYEYYLNVYDQSPTVSVQVTGAALIQTDTSGLIRSMAVSNSQTLTSGYTGFYALRIINNTGEKIFINSLIVEEIG